MDRARYAAFLKERELRKSRRRLEKYAPYKKQAEFHAAGRSYRERLFCAGNQLGKTWAGAAEVAFHATGNYPDWWEGKRFEKPVLIWTGSETNETSKGIVQNLLLGTTEPNQDLPEFGTGMLPYDSIVKVTTRQAGVKGVVDDILVRHASGGTSRIALKTYEQGRAKWQGESVHIVWFDEEPDSDIYFEGVTRTNATDGITFMTFTPLKGMSSVVETFFNPVEGDRPRHVTVMTIYDAGHYTDEEREDIISAYPDWERETRAMGVPMMGEGRVFPMSDDAIKVDPFPIPKHYALINGLDFGWDHPFGWVRLAWDRDADVIYVTDCFKKVHQTPDMQALVILSKGRNVPTAWPHDGLNTEKKSGEVLMKDYVRFGVNMLLLSARYDDKKGSSQDVEPAVTEILERMQTGRFKVFSTCTDWFEEFRMYHRKDGKIMPVKDDLMAATRYAVMMKRYAMPDIQMVAKPKRVPIVA